MWETPEMINLESWALLAGYACCVMRPLYPEVYSCLFFFWRGWRLPLLASSSTKATSRGRGKHTFHLWILIVSIIWVRQSFNIKLYPDLDWTFILLQIESLPNFNNIKLYPDSDRTFILLQIEPLPKFNCDSVAFLKCVRPGFGQDRRQAFRRLTLPTNRRRRP